MKEALALFAIIGVCAIVIAITIILTELYKNLTSK